MLQIVSFNVNSLRARMEIVLLFLNQHSPEIIGIQETKVQDEDFPFEPLADLGYEVIRHGQKTHYGVATLSTSEVLAFQKGFDDSLEEKQRRLILTSYALKNGEKLHVINGYFPQGESRNHPTKFPDKIIFYQNLLGLLKARFSPEDNVVVLGDFNVAADDKDVGIGENNKKRWLQNGKCSFLPEEREFFQELCAWGLTDTFRFLNPETDDRYSWFDYRSKGFEDSPKRGLRIDGILTTRPLLEKCVEVGIDYDTRNMTRPSDHCPIWARFDLTLS